SAYAHPCEPHYLHCAYTLYKPLTLTRIDTPSIYFSSPILSHHFNCSSDCLDGFSQILLFVLKSAFASTQQLLYCVPDGVTLHAVQLKDTVHVDVLVLHNAFSVCVAHCLISYKNRITSHELPYSTAAMLIKVAHITRIEQFWYSITNQKNPRITPNNPPIISFNMPTPLYFFRTCASVCRTSTATIPPRTVQTPAQQQPLRPS